MEETSGEFLVRLGVNGDLWAREFIKIDAEKHISKDLDTMRGWFSAAIMAGFDEGRRNIKKYDTSEDDE